MYRTVSSSGLPTKGTWTCWSESSQGTDNKGTEASAVRGEAEGAEAIQPGGEKARGNLTCLYKYPTAGGKKSKAGFSQWYSVTGQRAGSTD